MKDVAQVLPLFVLCVFYGQKSDTKEDRLFLGEIMTKGNCIVLMPKIGPTYMGLKQLLIRYSSVSLPPSILNDLFKVPEFHHQVVNEQLLEMAKDFCVTGCFRGLPLETACNNPAQGL